MLCWVQILSIINACKSELNHIKKVLRISGWGILVLLPWRTDSNGSTQLDVTSQRWPGTIIFPRGHHYLALICIRRSWGGLTINM